MNWRKGMGYLEDDVLKVDGGSFTNPRLGSEPSRGLKKIHFVQTSKGFSPILTRNIKI